MIIKQAIDLCLSDTIETFHGPAVIKSLTIGHGDVTIGLIFLHKSVTYDGSASLTVDARSNITVRGE